MRKIICGWLESCKRLLLVTNNTPPQDFIHPQMIFFNQGMIISFTGWMPSQLFLQLLPSNYINIISRIVVFNVIPLSSRGFLSFFLFCFLLFFNRSLNKWLHMNINTYYHLLLFNGRIITFLSGQWIQVNQDQKNVFNVDKPKQKHNKHWQYLLAITINNNSYYMANPVLGKSLCSG